MKILKKIKGNMLNKSIYLLCYEREIMNIIKNNFNRGLRDDTAFQLYNIAKSVCEKYPKYAIAELGVYLGDSARFICSIKKENRLYLFDTFKGLPKFSKQDKIDLSNVVLNENQFESSVEYVKDNLKGYDNVKIIKGLFPKSATKEIKAEKFCFIHLDFDLYKSTLDSLEFFYKRLISGGIILIHDYFTLNRVKEAVNKFFKNKPEIIIKLFSGYCMIVKK